MMAQTPATSNNCPGWGGSVGPFKEQYGQLHVYARDVHSGAGNCVCGNVLNHRLHVQAAPGVDIPGRVPPEPEYHKAWTELAAYIRGTQEEECVQLDPNDLLARMKELQIKALAPINTWIGEKTKAQEPERRTIVVAGNYQQFVRWCQDRDISRHDPYVRYASDEQHLRGNGGHIDIHIIGTFAERRDARRIRDMIQAIAGAYPNVKVFWE